MRIVPEDGSSELTAQIRLDGPMSRTVDSVAPVTIDDLVNDLVAQERKFWGTVLLDDPVEIDVNKIKDNETREKVHLRLT